MFYLNRRINFSLLPQDRSTFTASRNMGEISYRCFGGSSNQIVYDFPKSSRVRQTIHHESREHVGDIQGDIAPLFSSGDNVHTMVLQTPENTIPVWLGRNCDHGISGSQGSFDQTSKTNYKCCIIGIECHL